MNIYFYVNNEEGTHITTFYDMVYNPFKVGDEISLEVEELYPADYSKFKEVNQIILINKNKEQEELFNRKKIRLIKEGKYIKFKFVGENRLTIEYHCELLN